MAFYVIIVVIAGLCFLPRYLESRRIPVDGNLRKTAPGRFAQLSQGVTHYRWYGPTRGPVLVAVHGLTTPSIVWDKIGPALGKIGYRVLVYDLYGRGLSDTPDNAQDRGLFLQQIHDLLAHEHIEDQIALVGYSMGGSIATAFTAENPDKVSCLILVASAGIHTKESKFSEFCRTTPILGDWVHGVFADRRAQSAIKNDKTPSDIVGLTDAQIKQLGRKGFHRSVLLSRRGILSEIQEAEHRQISRQIIPVLAVWGDDDPVIPISALGELVKWNRRAKQESVAGANHGLPYSHTDQVVAAITEMLND